LPDGLTNIGEGIFDGCSILKTTYGSNDVAREYAEAIKGVTYVDLARKN
jgi:hypothetical protein